MEKISRRKFLKSLIASCTILPGLPFLLGLAKKKTELEPREAEYYKRLAG